MSELSKVKATFKYPNGMVATTGYDEQQIPELQGEFSMELFEKIKARSDGKTEWNGYETESKMDALE